MNNLIEKIQNKIINLERISPEEAKLIYEKMDLINLGFLANYIRQQKHPDSEPVTFVIDRNINYTNVCICKCKFCAFYRSEKDPDAYILSIDEILAKVQELVDIGGTQILLQGGLNSSISFDYYTNLLLTLSERFPAVALHAFSPPEICFFAKEMKSSVKEVLLALKNAGLSSLPGGGAEILSDHVRNVISPNKISSQDWLNVMEEAHSIGLSSTATLMVGTNETLNDIIVHLVKIRDLQDRTNGFRAFIPWNYQPANNTFQSEIVFTGQDYLRLVAISRIFLDNIDNVQVSWPTQGVNAAQIALQFGANDFGGLMTEENVISSTGHKIESSLNKLLIAIKALNRQPAQRTTDYKIIKFFD